MQSLRDFLCTLNTSIPGGIRITLVADGLEEDAKEIESACASWPLPVEGLVLSRNFGVGPALHAGLEGASECVVSALGSDLQEPQEVFVEFCRILFQGEADIALGVRRTRQDPLLPKLGALLFWRLNKALVDPESPPRGFDVFAVNREARGALMALPELNTSFTSQMLWIGFRRAWVPFDRHERTRGHSTWTLRRKAKLFSDALFGFTSIPATAIVMLGLAACSLLIGIGAVTLMGELLGLINVPGYTTILLVTAFGHSLTITLIGLVGGYAYRAFSNSTRRPHYIIRTRMSNDFDR